MKANDRSHPEERALLALLARELPPDEARRLTARLAREPELAAAWERLQATWDGLSLPPAAGVPPGFAARVVARAVAAPQGFRAAPRWVQAAGALALAAGLALGVGLGLGPGRQADDEIELSAPGLVETYAESYWDAMSDAAEVEP